MKNLFNAFAQSKGWNKYVTQYLVWRQFFSALCVALLRLCYRCLLRFRRSVQVFDTLEDLVRRLMIWIHTQYFRHMIFGPVKLAL